MNVSTTFLRDVKSQKLRRQVWSVRHGYCFLNLRIAVVIVLYLSMAFLAFAARALQISDSALQQIVALQSEKDARTVAQKKMDSQLIYAGRKLAKGVASSAAPEMAPDVKVQEDGRVLLDITATVSDELLGFISTAGGQIVNSFDRYDAIRALVPLDRVEELAGRADVRFVARAHEGTTNAGSVAGEGDTCHRAAQARSSFGVDGTGVRVGVLSDSVDYLANSQALGDLGPVTVLPGQGGLGAGEGTAMLEIVHDLAPGATLYFATANGGPASFAANIDALVSSNCTVIVDDYTYLYESPFQESQPIAQAVKRASDAGVLYFSSARNSGNKDSGTSGTWEGDFLDGGAAGSPLPSGRLHSFWGVNYTTVTAVDHARADLFWCDPLGASANDYDLYVLNSTGTSVLRSSTTTQSGSQDPYESVSTLNVGERIVILQKTGAADRFLHLDTGRCRLANNTAGNVRGHNASSANNAFSVAAVDVGTTSPFPSPFTGGNSNPVESFSSDGPRRLFFHPDGTPITPGNFSSTGGMLMQKPDITAADGAHGSTAVPGFSPFKGTSAAAPHAAAIAALLKSYNQSLSASQIRAALANTALDIEVAGFDRDSGAGIAMAFDALQSLGATSSNTLTIRIVGGSNPNTLIYLSPNDLNGVSGYFIDGNSGQVNAPYTANQTVTLTAPASSGATVFSTWTGADSQIGRTAKATMTSNRTVTAYYVSATAQPGNDLSIYTSGWDDTHGNGDGDHVMEGWEDVDLVLWLKSTANIQNVHGVLSSSVGDLAISDAQEDWPDISANDNERCIGTFDMVLNRDSYSSLPFTLRVDYEKNSLPYYQYLTFTKSFYRNGTRNADFDVVGWTIDDSIAVSTHNNADGKIQSGETVHLIPSVANVGTADGTSVTMSICYTNLPVIFELCEVEDYGDFNPGQTIGTEMFSVRDVRRNYSGNVCLDALFRWDQNTNGQLKMCEIPLTIYPEAWLDITEEAFDFGVASPGSSVTHTTLMQNVGSASLQITNITTSAADTTWVGPALPWTLAPGQSTNLVIQINTTGLQGQISRQVRAYATGRVRHPGEDDLLMVSGLVSEAVPIYQVPNVTGAYHPDISGDWIVWSDNSSGNADIYAFNIATGVKRQLTTNTNSQFNPVICGNLVVWDDSRDRGTNGYYDVYGYDLNRPDLGNFRVAPALNAGRARLLGVDANRVAFWHIYEWLFDSNSPNPANNVYVYAYQGNGLFTQFFTTGFTPGSGTNPRPTVNGPDYNSDGDFGEGLLTFIRGELYPYPSTGRWQTRNWTNQLVNYAAGETTPRPLPTGDYSHQLVASNRFVFERADANSDEQVWMWRHPGTVQQLTTTALDHVRDAVAIGGADGSDCLVYDYAEASRPGLYYLDRSNGQEFIIATNCNPDSDSLRMDGLRLVFVDENTSGSLNYSFLKQPDVQVSAPGITITPENPLEGTPVSVSVVVRNLSGYNQSGNMTASLYDGDPDAVATNLATPQSFTGLAAHTDRTLVFSNITSLVEGQHSIYVKLVVNTSDAPNNNKAFRQLTVGDSDTEPPVSVVQVSELNGDGDNIIGADEDTQISLMFSDQSGVASAIVILDVTNKWSVGPVVNWSIGMGKRTAGVHGLEIRATDADTGSPSTKTNRLNFTVVPAERLAVKYDNAAITNGQSVPIDLGVHVLGSRPLPFFVLENQGQQALFVAQLTVSGSFTATGPGLTNVSAGGLTTFTIRPITTTLGSYTGIVSIACSDTSATPFSFPVRARIISEPPQFTGVSVIGQFVRLNFRAPANSTCRLEWSADLSTWTLLRTVVLDGTGTGEEFTPISTAVNRRFYRIALQ